MSGFLRKLTTAIKRTFDRVFGFEAMRRLQGEIDRYHKNVDDLKSQNLELREKCESLEDTIDKGGEIIDDLIVRNTKLSRKLSKLANEACEIQMKLDDSCLAVKNALSACNATQAKLRELDETFLRDAGKWLVATGDLRGNLDAACCKLNNLMHVRENIRTEGRSS